MEIMEGIDPDPDNYVAGAILSTSTVLVGCLLRLKPNKQTEVCVFVCVYVCVYMRVHVVAMYTHVCVMVPCTSQSLYSNTTVTFCEAVDYVQ